jgi:hypothetical protein
MAETNVSKLIRLQIMKVWIRRYTAGRVVPGLAGLLLLSAATTDREARRSTDILPLVRSTPDTVLHPERTNRPSLLPPPRGLGVANIV